MPPNSVGVVEVERKAMVLDIIEDGVNVWIFETDLEQKIQTWPLGNYKFDFDLATIGVGHILRINEQRRQVSAIEEIGAMHIQPQPSADNTASRQRIEVPVYFVPLDYSLYPAGAKQKNLVKAYTDKLEYVPILNENQYRKHTIYQGNAIYYLEKKSKEKKVAKIYSTGWHLSSKGLLANSNEIQQKFSFVEGLVVDSSMADAFYVFNEEYGLASLRKDICAEQQIGIGDWIRFIWLVVDEAEKSDEGREIYPCQEDDMEFFRDRKIGIHPIKLPNSYYETKAISESQIQIMHKFNVPINPTKGCEYQLPHLGKFTDPKGLIGSNHHGSRIQIAINSRIVNYETAKFELASIFSPPIRREQSVQMTLSGNNGGAATVGIVDRPLIPPLASITVPADANVGQQSSGIQDQAKQNQQQVTQQHIPLQQSVVVAPVEPQNTKSFLESIAGGRKKPQQQQQMREPLAMLVNRNGNNNGGRDQQQQHQSQPPQHSSMPAAMNGGIGGGAEERNESTRMEMPTTTPPPTQRKSMPSNTIIVQGIVVEVVQNNYALAFSNDLSLSSKMIRIVPDDIEQQLPKSGQWLKPGQWLNIFMKKRFPNRPQNNERFVAFAEKCDPPFETSVGDKSEVKVRVKLNAKPEGTFYNKVLGTVNNIQRWINIPEELERPFVMAWCVKIKANSLEEYRFLDAHWEIAETHDAIWLEDDSPKKTRPQIKVEERVLPKIPYLCQPNRRSTNLDLDDGEQVIRIHREDRIVRPSPPKPMTSPQTMPVSRPQPIGHPSPPKPMTPPQPQSTTVSRPQPIGHPSPPKQSMPPQSTPKSRPQPIGHPSSPKTMTPPQSTPVSPSQNDVIELERTMVSMQLNNSPNMQPTQPTPTPTPPQTGDDEIDLLIDLNAGWENVEQQPVEMAEQPTMGAPMEKPYDYIGFVVSHDHRTRGYYIYTNQLSSEVFMPSEFVPRGIDKGTWLKFDTDFQGGRNVVCRCKKMAEWPFPVKEERNSVCMIVDALIATNYDLSSRKIATEYVPMVYDINRVIGKSHLGKKVSLKIKRHRLSDDLPKWQIEGVSRVY